MSMRCTDSIHGGCNPKKNGNVKKGIVEIEIYLISIFTMGLLYIGAVASFSIKNSGNAAVSCFVIPRPAFTGIQTRSTAYSVDSDVIRSTTYQVNARRNSEYSKLYTRNRKLDFNMFKSFCHKPGSDTNTKSIQFPSGAHRFFCRLGSGKEPRSSAKDDFQSISERNGRGYSMKKIYGNRIKAARKVWRPRTSAEEKNAKAVMRF